MGNLEDPVVDANLAEYQKWAEIRAVAAFVQDIDPLSGAVKLGWNLFVGPKDQFSKLQTSSVLSYFYKHNHR